MEARYTLTCDECGEPFYSKEAFPDPQYCPKCSAIYKVGEKQGRKEVVDSKIHINFACGTYTIQELLNMSNEGKIQLKEWGLLRQEMPK